MTGLIHIEKYFGDLAEVDQVLLAAIAILCLLLGMLNTIQLVIKLLRRRQGILFPCPQACLQFGSWLAIALAFQIGGDILL